MTAKVESHDIPEFSLRKTAKERLSDALYTAVSSLKYLSAEDCFTIAYVDHRFSVDYSLTIEEDNENG